MTHHVNYLYFDDGIQVREIINGARTIAHLQNSGIGCASVGIRAGECDVLSLDQCDYTPLEFSTPDAGVNPAPWWDGVANSPSSGGYGFWIEEWTGLDGAHMRRGATSIYSRGSSFGPLGQGHRVWKMNVLLFGADGVALDDLRNWLEENLIQCCSPGVTAWIRTTCPDGYSNDYGLAHVVNAQLLEGVEWIEPPIEALGCFMRRVSFTIGVGDPCLYRPPVQCLDNEPLPYPGAEIVISDGTTFSVRHSVSTNPRWDGGNLEIVWAGYADDWTPASADTMVAHSHATNPNDFGFILQLTTTGALRFRASLDGTSFGIDHTTTALLSAVAPAAGVLLWVSVRRSTNGVIEYRYSYNGKDWLLLEKTTAAAGLLNTPTYEIQIGSSIHVGGSMAGAVARVELWSGFKDDGGDMWALMDPNERAFDTAPPSVDPQVWYSPVGAAAVGFDYLEWNADQVGVTIGTYAGLMSLCSIGLAAILGCDEDPDAFADYRLCCNVAGERIGVTAPVVVLRNDNTERFSPPMRVVGITDNGSGCLVANNEIFGEVRISGVPPQSELMIDCARRRVLWRPVGFLRLWEPGYAYLDGSIGTVPDYPAVGCNPGIIFVEPTAITPALVDVSVTAWMVGRYGCC